METLRNADIVLFLRVFAFSGKKKIEESNQNWFFLQSEVPVK